MSELRQLQTRFLNYLRHADTEIERDIAGATELKRQERLSIYYNAYRIRLKGIVQTDHEILAKYLGDEWFDQMAIEYTNAHPSSQTSLRYFCEQLPEFLSSHQPYSDNPQLADLALWERLLMRAFDAARKPRLDQSYLASIAPEKWPELVLHFHPSVNTFATQWNSVEIWQAIKAESAPPDAVNTNDQTWLIWRNQELLTEFRSLSFEETVAFNFSHSGYSFAEVCEELQQSSDDVAPLMFGFLQNWISDGVLVAPSAAP